MYATIGLMVKTFPFTGIIYNKDKIKKPSEVCTPPYDVINPEEQQAFYEANDFNFIRIALGLEFPSDGEYNNKYIRAAATLDGWLRHKIMLQDDKPAFYAYQQVYHYRRKKYARLGFIGLLRLEDIGRGKVFPHEETYPKAKLDRLQIMRSTSANLESIFSIYSDEKQKVSKILKKFSKRKPLVEAKDRDGVIHRLWRVDRKPSIDKLAKEMRDKAVFIADGHHRYEAALRFKTELKTSNTKFSEEESYNHVMMYFNALEDPGLQVLPIHRVLRNLNYFDPIRFETELASYFTIKPYKATKRSAAATRKKLAKDLEKAGAQGLHAFGMYLGGYSYYLLTLKDEQSMEELAPEDKPKAWKLLDTNILHYIVIDKILKIAQTTEDKIVYVKEEEEAVRFVDKENCQLAFFLNPTKLEDITSIATKLERMPHKSTYFYPKLLSGLVLNKIVHGDKIKL